MILLRAAKVVLVVRRITSIDFVSFLGYSADECFYSRDLNYSLRWMHYE